MYTTGEWIDTTLQQVCESYPSYYYYDLYIWDSNKKGAELYFLGAIPQVYNKYKRNYVFFSDESEHSIYLEGTLEELEENDG